MGCPRHVYVFLLLCSFFALVEAGRGRQALEEMKRRQASARKSMEERVQRANRQRPNNKPRKNPAAKVAAAASATANVAAAAAFDGAFTAEEATVPAAAPPTTQPTDVLVDLRARLANLKRDIEKHAASARA
jgi:hypothetical protein